ncbi:MULTISPECIES: LLM class flavin-dependent oxidoreductase [unclassified Streptomyces]|uniref:LLM class flavin-dependent oxidoreductase n=1 Tax=unclassified Streptomyces TaxID=2593676 RepID=UPI0038286062
MTLHVGAQLPVNSIPGHGGDVDLAAVARHAEAVGLDSVWTGDRLSAPFPVLDSSLVLATAAAATERIALGYGVMLLALRSAAWAARQIGTLQLLSHGRVLLGVGVGSGDEAEWAAAGVPPRQRGERTDRLLTLLPGLLAGEPTELTDMPGRPRVALRPPAPAPAVWIGGTSDTALRRAVVHGKGWLSTMKTPEQFARATAGLADLAAERQVPVPDAGTNVFVRVTERPGAGASTAAADRLSALYGLDREAAAAVTVGGSPRQVAERLSEYVEAGAGLLVLVPLDDDTFQQYELFAETRALLLKG